MFKLNELNLKNINGISCLDLKFNDAVNLICGPNGIGKTTILDSIAQSFCTQSALNIKKKAGSELGQIFVKFKDNGNEGSSTYNVKSFSPSEKDVSHGLYLRAGEIILIHSHRYFNHQPLNSIEKDPVVQENQLYSRLANGIQSTEIKKWFVNRFLFSKHENSLSPTQINNLELAIKCFSELDPNINFSRVDAGSFDIYMNSPSGEIPFEYLSSGYKSTLVILIGLITEIEYRYNNPKLNAKDFSSIFLIDEIDVHLHPEWQAKLIISLKTIFPNAQIIATTHSPHVLQVCESNEIIALEFDQNQNIKRREIQQTNFGFQGWNVEEILSDIMGMTITRSPLYVETIKDFEDSLEEEDSDRIMANGNKLISMLHPQSELKKLISIQMAPYKV